MTQHPRALATDPESKAELQRRFGVARAAAKRGELASARRAHRTLVEAYPALSAAWINLGDVLLRQGDVASARSAFVTALETEPRVEAFVGLALCEQRSGDLAAALRVVESGKQRHPRHAELLYREAVLCFRTSRSEAAERACRGYLDQRSDDASVWELLGLVIEQRDQPRAGVEALTRAVELDPGAGVLCHRGLVRK